MTDLCSVMAEPTEHLWSEPYWQRLGGDTTYKQVCVRRGCDAERVHKETKEVTMQDWVKKHGAAVTAAAMAAGVLVANFGGLPPEAVDAIHGVVVAAGLVAGVAHAFLNGLGGNG